METEKEKTGSGAGHAILARDVATVSVVIPFFNQMDKLRRTADSLVNQQLRPSLVIFVDDLGNERLDPEIVSSLEEAGISSRLVVNERNLGPGGSRQAGFSLVPADTEYVLFLDSDDCVSQTFLSSSVQTHEARPDIIATFGDSVNRDTGASRVDRTRLPENLLDGIVNVRPWGTGALLWKHSMIRGLEWMPWKNIEDTHFELSAAMVNPRIAFAPDAVLYIDQDFTEGRLRTRNRSSDRQEHFARRRNIFESILMDFPFERLGVTPGRYLEMAAYHLVYFFPEGPASYLRSMMRMFARGRHRSGQLMAYRMPQYLFKWIRRQRMG